MSDRLRVSASSPERLVRDFDDPERNPSRNDIRILSIQSFSYHCYRLNILSRFSFRFDSSLTEILFFSPKAKTILFKVTMCIGIKSVLILRNVARL